ncbi:MAG: hypothetical protein RL376_720, partial [Verrucomicrobiota bacterium]
FFALPLGLLAQSLDPAIQAKVDAQITQIVALAADPALVQAVREQNAATPADYAAMTKEKWKTLPVLDPFVRAFTRNPAAAAIKARKTEFVTEAFVSDAAGLKVAFLAKTTSFSHKGSPKHEKPLASETWQGPVEVDESTGQQQLQVAVPILDAGKPIGSLVVGLSLTKLSS